MARGYRSRRFSARTSRRRRGMRRRSSMRKIKKDILKCNFPTKVKFMGLPEKKVMFFTYNGGFSLEKSSHSLLLEPLACPNISSIMSQIATGTGTGTVKFSNWDKFCILGIYIKLQPVKNQWTGTATDTINEVRCTYTYNNCPVETSMEYDKTNINNKQVFTFNSNEAFTIYIPAPPTMTYRQAYESTVNVIEGQGKVSVLHPQQSDCVVHKSKTWWSLADLRASGLEVEHNLGDEEDMDEDDEASEDIGTPYGNNLSPVMHAGRLFFTCEGSAKYNVTINYKVALKG